MEVIQWSWTADSSPGRTQACAASETVCTTAVYEPGTMRVQARIRGVTHEATARAVGIPCPTGNPLLDHPNVRKGMKDGWIGSKTDSLPAQRIERGFYSFRTSAGDTVSLLSPTVTGDTPCSAASIPSSIPGVAVLGGHTHPFSIGDTLPASSCNIKLKPGQIAIYGHGYGGLSGGDWRRAFNDQVPISAFDKDWIYLAEPPDSIGVKQAAGADTTWEPRGNWQQKVRSWPRKVAGCSRY